MSQQWRKQTTICYDLVEMAARDCKISTESEDAEDFAEDSTAGKLLPSDAANGSSESGSDRDDESEMGKVLFPRRRVEWETVKTWDREVLEDSHIRDCILNNAQHFMRGAGRRTCTFVHNINAEPELKKLPKHSYVPTHLWAMSTRVSPSLQITSR
jgi:hypothetical protein